ncbi:DUF3558 family protein [Nocardia wallacei]|uniref:DUF3558 family protein n=1 Tax=Nocardia wallacei TaxID=480035 RepID=UPI001E614AEE|nr:DUF3558 family protein [Nocardia wallacei]
MLSAACTSRDDSDGPGTTTSTAAKPSISVSVNPAPEQDPAGSKPVAYDPCLEIGDETIAKAGFDPATRERSDQVHTGYAFIGCTFERKEQVGGVSRRVGSLTISSTNISLDQFRKREGSAAREIKINGKEAITYGMAAAEACNVVTNGPDGAIDVQVDSAAALSNWRGCDHVQEIASTIDAVVSEK